MKRLKATSSADVSVKPLIILETVAKPLRMGSLFKAPRRSRASHATFLYCIGVINDEVVSAG